MFKDIKGIVYDGGEPGRAFGGGIFAASCNVGFSASPTKITLSIVSEDGTYKQKDINDQLVDLVDAEGNDTALNVTSTGSKTIEVGDIKFHNMYLYSYSFNDTPSSKTMTAEFVDQSVCLDKIFVGLAMRHGTSTANDALFHGGGWNYYNPKSLVQVTAFSQVYEFRLMCTECNSLRPRKYVRPSSKEDPARITRMSYMAGDGSAGPAPLATFIQVNPGVDCVDGGYMLLGREGFTETPCETPKVEYNFDELCDALDYILGGDPNNFLGQGIKYKHNLRDFKRSSTYTASYTGNLREVLSAWAADFSFDFSFDYTKEDLWIEGISLEDPVNLNEIKEAIELGFGQDSENALIRNMTEKITLENTYKQTPLVKYIKPPRPFVRNQKHYEQAVGKVLKLEDAVGQRANLGRSWDELYISIALAKFQPEARILWLSDQARKKYLDPDWVNPDVYPTAGNVNPHFGAGLPGQANFPGGCKECPNWDKQLNANGSKKWTSEYECIKNGEGTGSVIPNNPSMPLEEWFQYDIPLNKWGKVKRFPNEMRYHNPDCLLRPQGHDESHFADYYCNKLANHALAIQNASQRPGWQNAAWRIDIPWMALGFFPERRLTNATQRHDLLSAHKEAMQGKIKNPFKHPIWKSAENYDCLIGVWNKNFQNKVLEYDKDVADNFFGKYAWWYGNRTDEGELAMGIPPNYGPINPPPSEQQCPKWLFDYEAQSKHRTYMYRFDVKTSPESNVYSGNSYPFIEVLKVNDYIFADNGKAINGDDTDPCTYCPERAIFEIEDNTWGTPQEVIDDLFHNRYIVDTEHSSPSFSPQALTAMTDIGEYVPIYTVLRQDRQVRDLYKTLGIRYFDQSVYKPEHAESGYFPGVAFIPRLDKCIDEVKPDGSGGDPILKIDYEHWYCEATTTTAFCETGCPPCTCGDILDAISGETCDPPDCIEPCWDCMGPKAKKYGNVRSSGTPNPPPDDPATGSPWVSDPDKPNYEPFNPAWQSCLTLACQEDYGYCEKDKKIIGYPTARTIDDNPLPAMDKTSCEAIDEATWKGSDNPAECVSNEAIDVKASVNADPNACACWECSINEVGMGVYYFGDETKAKEFCGQNSTIAQKDEITVTAGDTVGGSIKVTFSLASGPVVVTTQSFANDDDSTAVQLATDILGSGITGITATASGNIVSVVTPALPNGTPVLADKTVAVGTSPSTASATSTFGETIEAIRIPSSASGGECGVGPEGPCPAGVYLSGAELVNAKVYDNTRRRVMEWHAENASPKDCTLWCEEDIVKTVCGCDPPNEPIHKFSNYRARYFNITHRAITKKIIFPIEHDYVGYWFSDATEKGYYPRKHIVLGTPPDLANLEAPDPNDPNFNPLAAKVGANVMETRIVDVDVTQDLDSIEMGDNNSPGSYHEQLVVNNPYNRDADDQPIPEVVNLPTYYTFLRAVNKSADNANRTLNIRVDGTEFDTLKTLLTPAKGLSSFTVSVGSDGIATDITYVSRPAKLPKRDVLMQKIGPRAIEGRIPKPSVDTIMNDWNIK